MCICIVCFTRGSTGSQRNWKKSRTDKGRRRRRRRRRKRRFIRCSWGGGVPGRCGGENVQGNYSYEKEDTCHMRRRISVKGKRCRGMR